MTNKNAKFYLYNKSSVFVFLVYTISFTVFSANQQQNSHVKLLKSTDSPKTISLKDAFGLGFKYYDQLKLAQNRYGIVEAQKIQHFASMLPKVRLDGAYRRNIPEVKIDMAKGNANQSVLYERVAELYRKDGDDQTASSLQASADLMRRRSGGQIITNPKHSLEAKITLEIPIINGPNIFRILQANDAISLEQARLKEEQAKTIYIIAKEFMQVRFLEKIAMLRSNQEKTAKERFEKAKDQYRYGILDKSDYLQIESSYWAIAADSQSGILDYRSTLAELGMKLGQEEEFLIENVENIDFDILNNSEEALTNIALQNRPDLKAQRKSVAISKKEHAVGFLRFLPVLSFQADAKYNSNTEGLMKESWTGSLSLNLSWQLFDGGRRFGMLKENSLKNAEENIKLNHLLKEITISVRGRKAKLNSLKTQIKSRKSLYRALSEKALLARDRYGLGLIELKELLDAQDESFNAEINYNKSLNDLLDEKMAFVYELGLLTPNFIEE